MCFSTLQRYSKSSNYANIFPTIFKFLEVKMEVKMEVNSLRSWELKWTFHKDASLTPQGRILMAIRMHPCEGGGLLLALQIVVAEVLAVGGQLVMFQIGKEVLELQEEAFARGISVGVHAKFS